MTEQTKSEFQIHLEALEKAHPNFKVPDLHPHEKSRLILLYLLEDRKRAIGLYKEALTSAPQSIGSIIDAVCEGKPEDLYGLTCYLLGEQAFSRILLRLESIRAKNKTMH